MLFLLKPITPKKTGLFKRLFIRTKPTVVYEVVDNTAIGIIEAPIKNETINWKAVCRLVGQDPLLFPKYFTPPPEFSIPTFNCSTFKLQILCNTVLKLLKQSDIPPRERKVCLYDPDGKLPGYALHLLKTAGTVEVITNNRAAYADEADAACETLGTDLILTDKTPAKCSFHLLFSPFENEIYCYDIFEKYTLDERLSILPEKFKRILPFGISEYDLGGALYQLEKRKELGKLTATFLAKNGQTVYTKDLVLLNKKDA